MSRYLQSPVFQNNPALYSFIPMFYMAWADAVLTPGEIIELRKIIDDQSWLTPHEIDFLLSFIDPSLPPSPDELKSWMVEIKKSSTTISSKDKRTLVQVGLDLAKFNGKELHDEEHNILTPLHAIEKALGIISMESDYHLQAAKHHTVTSSQQTREIFDFETMGDILDGEYKETIHGIKTLMSDPEFQYVDLDNLNDYRNKILDWLKELAIRGYGATAYPEEYGGKNNMGEYFTVMETLSYHDLSLVVKFGVQFGLFGMSVYFLGTEHHHKKYMAKIGSLELPGCFAMTETGHGSNVKGIETTAVYDHSTKKITINTPNTEAGKEYIGNAALHGKMATVFAKLIIGETDYGVNAFLVPLRDDLGNALPGIMIEDCGRKMGLNGVDNGRIYFNNVSIPLVNMLDRFAHIDENGNFQSDITSDNRRFFTMLSTLVGGRIGIPRMGISACKSGLTIAIRYSDKRRQFGPQNGEEVPILNYRTHQRRLMPLLAKTYALHFSLKYVTKRYLEKSENDYMEVEALAAGLKAYTTWHTTRTLQECRETCGGKAYLHENRIDSLKNDTEIFTTFEGDNWVLMQLVAKARLSEFKKEFGDINLFGMLNYVMGQTMTHIVEMNPLTVRNTDEDHLLDHEFHLNAFLFREKEVLSSAAKRLRKHLSQNMDSFDAFNQTQNHMIEVGKAFIERVVLEQFWKSVNEIKDQKCKEVLIKLYQLHALSTIELNKGWYLEQDYMSGTKTKAIRKLVNHLCWETRQDAVPLVDSFRIPDQLLSAPIARKYGNSNSD